MEDSRMDIVWDVFDFERELDLSELDDEEGLQYNKAQPRETVAYELAGTTLVAVRYQTPGWHPTASIWYVPNTIQHYPVEPGIDEWDHVEAQ